MLNGGRRWPPGGHAAHQRQQTRRKSLTSVALITPMVVKDWWESVGGAGTTFLGWCAHQWQRNRDLIYLSVCVYGHFLSLRQSQYGFPVLVATFDNVISQHFDLYQFTSLILELEGFNCKTTEHLNYNIESRLQVTSKMCLLSVWLYTLTAQPALRSI